MPDDTTNPLIDGERPKPPEGAPRVEDAAAACGLSPEDVRATLAWAETSLPIGERHLLQQRLNSHEQYADAVGDLWQRRQQALAAVAQQEALHAAAATLNAEAAAIEAAGGFTNGADIVRAIKDPRADHDPAYQRRLSAKLMLTPEHIRAQALLQ